MQHGVGGPERPVPVGRAVVLDQLGHRDVAERLGLQGLSPGLVVPAELVGRGQPPGDLAKLSELRSEQAEVERTIRLRITDGGCRISHRKRFDLPPCSMEYYGIGEMPAPNHEARRTSGGSHGDDTGSDGASLPGPQPYEGGNESSPGVPPVPSECGLEPRRLGQPKSDGRIPRPSGRGGGQ